MQSPIASCFGAVFAATLLLGGCFSPDEPADAGTEASTSDGTQTTGTASESGTSATGSTTTTSSADTSTSTSTTTGVDTSATDDTATTGVPPSCGDGTVDEGEVCDDGTNAGAAPGDCAPDCSAVVQEKIIRLSQDPALPDFAAGQPSFVDAADAMCPNGYLAMIADGTNRVASLAAYMGNGQVDWPIQPWIRYVNPDGATVWTTTALRLLGVSDDNQWVGLENPVTDASLTTAFTSMVQDYTTSPLNCLGFSTATGSSGDSRVAFGLANQTSEAAIGPSGPESGGGCSFERHVYCIEQ